MRAFLQREFWLPRWMSWMSAGFILGCLFLFGSPAAVRADADSCRACMAECHAAYPAYAANRCFDECGSDVRHRCEGTSLSAASIGFGSSVSGAGTRTSRVEGTTSNPGSTSGGTAPTTPTGNCVDTAVSNHRATTEEAATIVGRSGHESTTWSCQRTCTTAQRGVCIRGGCPDNPDAAVLCCPPAGGIAIGERCGARGATSPTPGENGSAPAGSAGSGASTDRATSTSSGSSGGGARFDLPPCITSGNCQIQDILQTAINAVQFLFGLSGVFLLIAFVYSGVEYLMADTIAGFSVKSAKERLGKSVTGILIMFFGYTLVKFLVNLLVH